LLHDVFSLASTAHGYTRTKIAGSSGTGSDPHAFRLWALGLTMTLKKLATTAAVTLGLLASHAAMFTSAAEARDHHGWRKGYDRPYAAYGHGRHQPQPYHYGQRRDRSGDAVGAAILGIGALIVGAAIADAARKKRHSYESYDD
jgi:hypothetical protein